MTQRRQLQHEVAWGNSGGPLTLIELLRYGEMVELELLWDLECMQSP